MVRGGHRCRRHDCGQPSRGRGVRDRRRASRRGGGAGPRLPGPTEPSAARSAAPRDLLRSPAMQGVLAFLIYLAAMLETPFRPILVRASQSLLDQQSMDPNFYVWGLRWWPYAIGHGLNPLYSHQIAAPAGHSLAWVTTAPPLALVAAPL